MYRRNEEVVVDLGYRPEMDRHLAVIRGPYGLLISDGEVRIPLTFHHVEWTVDPELAAHSIAARHAYLQKKQSKRLPPRKTTLPVGSPDGWLAMQDRWDRRAWVLWRYGYSTWASLIGTAQDVEGLMEYLNEDHRGSGVLSDLLERVFDLG